MKKRRILACLLAAVLLLTLVPWTPAAAQGDQPVPEPQQTPAPDSGDEPAVSEHVMRLPAEEGQDLHRLVYLNEDGSRTLYLFDHPVKYVDADGTVRDISLETADGATDQARFVTAANAAVTSFSRTLWDGISLSGNGTNLRLVPVQPELDGTLSATEEATAQRLDSETIQYRYDAATTFEYSLTYTGFKEDIVVSQYTGQTEYAFFLYTDGLSVTQLQDSWYLTDDTGAVRAAIGDIVVFTADERNNTMGRMESEVIKENEIYLLTIVLDADYLADPNTVYPIRIDPTVDIIYEQSGEEAIEDVTIYSNATSQGQFTASVVGKTSNGIARLLMRFPNFDFSAQEGATVTYARVTPRDILCEGEEMTVTCYPFTGSAWTESTAQWSNLTQSWDASMGVSLPISYSKGLEQPTDHWYRFEITDLVQKWIDGEADPALGIIFKADSTVENGSAYLHKTFGSYERSGYKPWFTMTYLWDLQLNHGVKDIDEGGSFTLTATTSDGPATNVTWTSSNTAVATVDANGVVTAHKAGVATITATSPDAVKPAICRVYVTIADGVYYIQNMNSELYLHVEDGGISNHTRVKQFVRYGHTADVPYKLMQTWKVKHLGNGCYSVRPMLKLDMALEVTNNRVDIYKVGTSDSFVHIPVFATWVIEYSRNGYVFRPKNSTYVMQVENASSSSNVNVITSVYSEDSLNCHWDFVDSSTGIPSGVVMYDTKDGTKIAQWKSSQGNGALTNIVVWLAPEETRTLEDFNIAVAAYSENAIYQDFYWHTESTDVSIDCETGAITGIMKQVPLIEIIGEITLDDGVTYTVVFSLIMTEVPNGTYYIRNWASDKHADIEDQSMVAGTPVHQWEFHGGDTQKWVFTHLGDGTYSIHSYNSENIYYLGVDGDSAENEQPVLLRTGDILIGMKWKIASTISGAYTLTPMSAEDDNLVLAVDSNILGGIFGNGYALQQCNYVADQNYRDEWLLCPVSSTYQLEGQQTDVWCWVASARMASFAYMDSPISQAAAAVEAKIGGRPFFPTNTEIDEATEGGTSYHIKMALEYIIGSENVYTTNKRIYDEATLRSILDNSCPVIINRGWYIDGNREGGHTTVICGYRLDAASGEYLYEIFDPWPMNSGSIYLRSYAWICNGHDIAVVDVDQIDNGIWEDVVVFEAGNYANTISWPGV